MLADTRRMVLRLLIAAALCVAGVALAYALSVMEMHFNKRPPLKYAFPGQERTPE